MLGHTSVLGKTQQLHAAAGGVLAAKDEIKALNYSAWSDPHFGDSQWVTRLPQSTYNLLHWAITKLSNASGYLQSSTTGLAVIKWDFLPDLSSEFRHLVAHEVETYSHTGAILKP